MTSGVRTDYAVELASAPVISIDAGIDALAALRVMHANQIRHLPVLSDGTCVGLVSETDLLIGLLTRMRGPLPRCDELCRHPPPTVDGEMTWAGAARVMREAGSDAVVVRSGEQIVGVLTAVDVVRSLAHEGESDE